MTTDPMRDPSRAEFQWPVRVYWEDTDAGGIVFYANYLKFFEQARTEWLRSLGLQQNALRQSNSGMFVVSQAELRYLHPARLDDALRVTAKLIEIKRASMTIAQQAIKTTPGVEPLLLCEGTIRIGWIDDRNYKPARIPSTVLEILK